MKGLDGKPIGTYNTNPLLDTRKYLVRFKSGEEDELMANAVAENIYSQCDPQGRQFQLMEDIIEFWTNGDALTDDEESTVLLKGKQHPIATTKGWSFLVQWKRGESTWVPLKDLKKSNPIEVAEFAISRKLENKPAFRCWVSKVLEKRNLFIGKIKSRYLDTSHKFGIRLPHSVDEAIKLDKENKNTMWQDAIAKEMVNVRPTFKPLIGSVQEAKSKMVGYQQIRCHMIFAT